MRGPSANHYANGCGTRYGSRVWIRWRRGMKFWGSAAMLAALSVGACASAGNDVLRTQDAKAVDQNIMDGKTTRSEVESMYGAPTATSSASAQSENWVYRWSRATCRPENFVP